MLERRRAAGAAMNDVFAEDYDVDAPVLGSALRCVVAGDGVIFGVSGGGQAVGREAVTQDEKTDQFRGTRGRKLPVGRHLSGMDGNVVGVTFDAQTAGADRKDGGDAIEGGQRGRFQGGGSAVEKSELAQADDQAFDLAMQGDGVQRDFVLQGLL